MRQKVKPDYSKFYANKVDQETFAEHFKDAYPTLTEDEFKESWQGLQDEKENKLKEAEKDKPKKATVK